MRNIVARVAAAVILATGIFAGSPGPANAAPENHLSVSTARWAMDTGWG